MTSLIENAYWMRIFRKQMRRTMNQSNQRNFGATFFFDQPKTIRLRFNVIYFVKNIQSPSMSHSMQLHCVADEIVHEWNGEREKTTKYFCLGRLLLLFRRRLLIFIFLLLLFLPHTNWCRFQTNAHTVCTHTVYYIIVYHSLSDWRPENVTQTRHTKKNTTPKWKHIDSYRNSVHRARNVLSTQWCEWGSLRMYWSTLIFISCSFPVPNFGVCAWNGREFGRTVVGAHVRSFGSRFWCAKRCSTHGTSTVRPCERRLTFVESMIYSLCICVWMLMPNPRGECDTCEDLIKFEF